MPSSPFSLAIDPRGVGVWVKIVVPLMVKQTVCSSRRSTSMSVSAAPQDARRQVSITAGSSAHSGAGTGTGTGTRIKLHATNSESRFVSTGINEDEDSSSSVAREASMTPPRRGGTLPSARPGSDATGGYEYWRGQHSDEAPPQMSIPRASANMGPSATPWRGAKTVRVRLPELPRRVAPLGSFRADHLWQYLKWVCPYPVS